MNRRTIIGIAVATVLVTLSVVLAQLYIRSVPSLAEATSVEWYERKASQWERQAQILRASQVLLAVLAIGSSVLAASEWKPRAVPPGAPAVIAAISIALITGLDLSPQANKMRNAHRHLTVAILKYKQSTPSSLDDVRKSYDEAEKMIGDYTPKPSS